jgi:FkbM family methyltransferase
VIVNFPGIFGAIRTLCSRRFGEGSLARYATPHGEFFLPKFPKSDSVARAVRSGRLWDESVIDAVMTYYRRSTFILDVGANFGQMSVVLANRILAQDGALTGTIVAFEAEPYVCDILRRNVILNQVDHVVKIINKPVWDSIGVELPFPEPDFVRFGSWGSYGVSPEDVHGRRLPSTTIDDELFGHSVSVIKIDVQGSDLRALKGAVKTISKNKPMLIFEFTQDFVSTFHDTFQDYIDFIHSIDYYFSEVIDSNYLCLPR